MAYQHVKNCLKEVMSSNLLASGPIIKHWMFDQHYWLLMPKLLGLLHCNAGLTWGKLRRKILIDYTSLRGKPMEHRQWWRKSLVMFSHISFLVAGLDIYSRRIFSILPPQNSKSAHPLVIYTE